MNHTQDELGKWIFYIEGLITKKSLWFPANCHPKELLVLLEELRRWRFQEFGMDNPMVCLNEWCVYYARKSCVKFQHSFKHCPECGAHMVTEVSAMRMLKE